MLAFGYAHIEFNAENLREFEGILNKLLFACWMAKIQEEKIQGIGKLKRNIEIDFEVLCNFAATSKGAVSVSLASSHCICC